MSWTDTPCVLWVDLPGSGRIRKWWTKHRGPIPSGQCVLHYCDNRGCRNLEHLWLGTLSQNSQDMVTKNRHSGWSSSFNEARKGKSLSEEHKKAISKTRKSGQTWYLKYLKKEEDDTSDGGP